MKCPNCGETLNHDAEVCTVCGSEIQDTHFEDLVDSIIKEDEAEKNGGTVPVSNDEGVSKKKKFGFTLKKDSKESAKTKEARKSKDSSKSKEKKTKVTSTVIPNEETSAKKAEFGRGVQITRYATAVIVLLFLLTMLFDWFTLGGRGVFKGFILDENSGAFMTGEVMTMTTEQIENLAPEVAVLSYSPKDLMDYVDLYEDLYKVLPDKDGEEKASMGVLVQTIYIQGFLLILGLALLTILFLALDKRLLTVEWSRGFSVLSIVIIGLNYASMKIPFLSMFALRARNLLRFENQLSSVTMNLNGINMNNEFYPYEMMETTGFFVAIGACALWFVMTTVLVEMKKDKEYS